MRLENPFRLDERSLAAFRAGLGAVLLIDLFGLMPHAGAYFSDAGMLPWKALHADLIADWSLHALSGAVGWQIFLLALSVLFALGLAAGLHTRICAAMSWILFVSMAHRNPYILNVGDEVLGIYLLWASFLPLSRRWSLDALRRKKEPAALPAAEIGYLLQFAFFYFFSGMRKLMDPAWSSLDFFAWLFVHPHIGSPWAARHLSEPFVRRSLCLAVLLAESAAPFLLVLPMGRARNRLAAIAIFVGLQAGIYFFLGLRLVPLVMTVGLLPFVPAEAWGPYEKEARKEPPAGSSWIRGLLSGFCVFAVAVPLTANLACIKPLGLRIPGWQIQAMSFFDLHPATGMFTAHDLSAYSVNVFGDLESGRRVNLLAKDPAGAPAKPLALEAVEFPPERTLSAAFSCRKDYACWANLARYYCARWAGGDHVDPIVTVHVEYGLRWPVPSPESRGDPDGFSSTCR